MRMKSVNKPTPSVLFTVYLDNIVYFHIYIYIYIYIALAKALANFFEAKLFVLDVNDFSLQLKYIYNSNAYVHAIR